MSPNAGRRRMKRIAQPWHTYGAWPAGAARCGERVCEGGGGVAVVEAVVAGWGKVATKMKPNENACRMVRGAEVEAGSGSCMLFR